MTRFQMQLSQKTMKFGPLLLLTLALVPLGGCTGGNTGRVAFRGKVTRDGDPVSRGFVSFRPANGAKGPAANADIVDGEYGFTNYDGPAPGPHHVLVNVAATGNKSAGASQQVEPTRWEFDVDVRDSEEFAADFELESP